jgi:hypothetical protein
MMTIDPLAIPQKIIEMLKKQEVQLEYLEIPDTAVKFRHYILIRFKWRPDLELLMDINDWLKTTYGPIGGQWGMYHYDREKQFSSDNEYRSIYEFRFQAKDDAMRFKLVWG